ISHWWRALVSGHVIFTPLVMPDWMLTFARFAPDKGSGRGAVPAYTLERHRIEMSDVALPVRTGPWRGLGAAPNHLAVELGMHRLALKAKQDPLSFRLSHLPRQHAR